MLKYTVSNNSAEFSNLEEALLKARYESESIKDGEGIKISIDGFIPQLSKLKITNDMLPKGDNPITIEGIGENSGFDGGMKIQGMRRFRDNIWCVKLPDIEYTRHLYIDGKMANRPSTPYKKSNKHAMLESEHFEFVDLPEDVCENGYHSGIATTYTNIADWRNITDVEMVFDVGWTHKIVPIERVELWENNKVFIKPDELVYKAVTKDMFYVIRAGSCPSCFQNVFELLGKPLEWYFDRNEKMLYIGFEENDSPENHDIRLPISEQLFEISGEPENPVCNLKFKNITFRNTTWLWPQKYGFPELQACIMNYPDISEIKECNYSILSKMQETAPPYEQDYRKVISAVRVISARNVSFENCKFTMLGTGALMYEYGAQNSKIIGNKFFDIAASAITLGEFYPERAHHPEKSEEIVRLIEVSNNHIYNTGRELFGSVALIAGYVQDVTIAHNYIHNVPYTAISLGWGWGYSDVSVGPYRPTPWKEPSVCMRNKIVNNHIHNAMSVLYDGGAIYTLGCMDGTIISGNHIHEGSGYIGEGYDEVGICGYDTEQFCNDRLGKFFIHGAPGGIYLDEGSQGIEVSNNLIYDILIPLYYHNQIDKGYEKVSFINNILNMKPNSNSLTQIIAKTAGLEPEYR